MPEASVEMEVSASDEGKLSIETSPRAFLVVRKTLSATKVQTKVTLSFLAGLDHSIEWPEKKWAVRDKAIVIVQQAQELLKLALG